jgi:hypothetical protein
VTKQLEKAERSLESLLEKRLELDAQINRIWEQEVRPLRIAGIRGGAEVGPLPAFVGLDEQKRAST